MVRVSSTRGRGAPLHADDLPERLRRDPPSDEAALAELIDADGRARSRLGDPTGLERYLDAVPGLEGMPVALDAAIEAALRGMCASGRSEEEAVASLVESYPHLRDAIAEAAALNRGLWSTRWLIDRLDDLPPRDLPWDVGPVLEGGRRRYRLTEVLGRGSCGEVYLGEDRRLSDSGHPALVAVKILDGRQASVDARRRFLGEAMRARRVQHPTVVRVLDRGESDGALFIVYEHVRGRTLARYLTEHGGRIDAREAARLVSKIARGVHAAHAAGLIHCDLHPTNVLIDEEGEPRICDFGIAVLADELPGQGLGAWGGRALGSLAFIPPEQHRLEEGAFGAAADVYALGGLLHFLITGDLPNGTSAAQIRARLDADEGAASRLDDRADALDADLGAIRRRALATDPGDRHPSSLELGEDLEAWLSHRPIEWTRPSAVRRARLQVRRRPVVAALACLAGAGLIVGASALSYSYGVVHTRRQRLLDWYGDLRAELGDLRKESDGASLLLGLWLLDKQRADLSMGDDGRVPELARAAGIDTLAAMVEGAYTNAGPADPAVLLMESTLVTLMLVDKQPHPEARAIIERNRENWARLLPAGSRTLAEADVLAAVADIKGAFHGARAGRPIDEPTLRRAERVLLGSLPMFEGWYRDSELHVLTVRALRSLYGQHLLRDAVEYERFREIYLRHTGKSRSESADPQPDWNRYEEWRELRRNGANDGTDEAGSAVH